MLRQRAFVSQLLLFFSFAVSRKINGSCGISDEKMRRSLFSHRNQQREVKLRAPSPHDVINPFPPLGVTAALCPLMKPLLTSVNNFLSTQNLKQIHVGVFFIHLVCFGGGCSVLGICAEYVSRICWNCVTLVL